jgi:hypothetical protein
VSSGSVPALGQHMTQMLQETGPSHGEVDELVFG